MLAIIGRAATSVALATLLSSKRTSPAGLSSRNDVFQLGIYILSGPSVPVGQANRGRWCGRSTGLTEKTSVPAGRAGRGRKPAGDKPTSRGQALPLQRFCPSPAGLSSRNDVFQLGSYIPHARPACRLVLDEPAGDASRPGTQAGRGQTHQPATSIALATLLSSKRTSPAGLSSRNDVFQLGIYIPHARPACRLVRTSRPGTQASRRQTHQPATSIALDRSV